MGASAFVIGRQTDAGGELKQTAGNVNVTAGNISLGKSDNAVGTINISGGTFAHTTGKIIVGENATGIFNQSGTADVSFERVEIGRYAGSHGTYTISGGELDVNRYLYGQNSVFKVVGKGASHIRTQKLEMNFSTAKLSVELDALGSTLIEVLGETESAYYGALLAGSTFEVNTLSGFNGIVGSVYDILWSASTIDTTGMVFANLSATQFSWDVVDKNGGEMLQLTVIPEPATIGLLALGSLIFASRRRNK